MTYFHIPSCRYSLAIPLGGSCESEYVKVLSFENQQLIELTKLEYFNNKFSTSEFNISKST